MLCSVPAKPPPRTARVMQSSAGIQSAITAGPAIGGLSFMASASVVYATCTLIFCVAAFLLRLRYAHMPAPAEQASLRSLLAGMACVWARKIFPGAVSLDLFAELLGGASALAYPRVAWGSCVRPRR